MSTLLQRMARRARESPLEAQPRIEPVLASSFGPRMGEGMAGAIERYGQTQARVADLPDGPEVRDSRAAHEPPVPAEARTDPHRAHADEASHARPGESPQWQARSTKQASPQAHAIVAHATLEAAGATPVGPHVGEHALPRRDRPAKIEPVLDATPAAVMSARETAPGQRWSETTAPSRAPERHTVEHAARSKPTSEPTAVPAPPRSDPRVPDEAPAPTITITFGRVEVRQASAPPAPPRAPFRPAVSLDAFLRRGGGNAR